MKFLRGMSTHVRPFYAHAMLAAYSAAGFVALADSQDLPAALFFAVAAVWAVSLVWSRVAGRSGDDARARRELAAVISGRIASAEIVYRDERFVYILRCSGPPLGRSWHVWRGGLERIEPGMSRVAVLERLTCRAGCPWAAREVYALDMSMSLSGEVETSGCVRLPAGLRGPARLHAAEMRELAGQIAVAIPGLLVS